jgi:excisionase family DNA binding protein
MDSPTGDKLLTVPEVARLLRVGANTVYREIQKGRLKASRVGRLIRVQSSDVQKYLDNVGKGESDSR